MSKIKICGLTRSADIDAVNQLLPDYVGFVFAASRRQIGREQAGEFSRCLDSRIKSVGVFVNQPLDMIIEYLQEGLIWAAQLHGQETEADIFRIKAETGKTVIKAVSVTAPEDIRSWQESVADYLLFDQGSGGSGTRFPWEYLKQIYTEAAGKPYFLAGGLNAGNIEAALEYQPFAVDISSGAESKQRKDPEKIKQLITMVRNIK